ncbi:MAG: hypothetical protein WCP52_05790 [Bacteroidota bacterium]
MSFKVSDTKIIEKNNMFFSFGVIFFKSRPNTYRKQYVKYYLSAFYTIQDVIKPICVTHQDTLVIKMHWCVPHLNTSATKMRWCVPHLDTSATKMRWCVAHLDTSTTIMHWCAVHQGI